MEPIRRKQIKLQCFISYFDSKALKRSINTDEICSTKINVKDSVSAHTIVSKNKNFYYFHIWNVSSLSNGLIA